MSFAIIYPRTIRNGASFEEVADGEFPITEKQEASFVGSVARDVGIGNHSIRDGSNGFRRRHGLRWTVKLGGNFSEVFTRSGIIGNLAPDAWFKGDEGVTLVGTSVSAWGDLSGHGRNLTQNTPSDRPTTVELNGIQILSTVSTKSMDFSSVISVKSAVFVVNNFQPSTGGASSSVVFGETSGVVNDSDYTFLLINDVPAGYTISIDGNKGTSGNSSLDNGSLASGQNIDLGVSFVTGDGPHWFYVDWSDVSVDVGHISRFVTNLIDISGSMEFAEIIFFPNVLDVTDRYNIYEKYLRPLWNLTGLQYWTFNSISTSLWLRGDRNIITVSSNVSEWGDVKGNGLVLTQDSALLRPSLATLNGRQVVDMAQGRELSLSTEISIRAFLVVVTEIRPSDESVTVSSLFQETNSVTPAQGVFVRVDSMDFTISISNVGGDANTGRASVNGGSLSATGTLIDLGVNPVSGDGPYIFYVEYDNPQRVQRFGIIDDTTKQRRGDNYIGEYVFLPDIPDQSTIDKAVGRLAWDWGITSVLPGDHPYKTQEPTL